MNTGKDGELQVLPVQVKDLQDLVGQYMRHVDTREIYEITHVGVKGVTALRAEGFGSKGAGAPHEITWRSVKHKHRMMVHVTDIETQGNA